MELHEITALAEEFVHISATNSADLRNSLPGLAVIRREHQNPVESTIYKPVVCLILRGSKTVTAAGEEFNLGLGDALLVSHDSPVASRITQANPKEPYLAIILSIDMETIRGLYDQVGEAATAPGVSRSLAADVADPSWINPLGRYLALINDPMGAKVLGPMILTEIHYRLLMSAQGEMFRNLLCSHSSASRIGRAIAHIRQDYHKPLSINDLAKLAGMSQSTFHSHFKSITGTTPLQYQKELRIIEARRRLKEGGQSISAISFDVGYQSPSQFSREYSRKFGLSPREEINAKPRRHGIVAG